MAYKNLITLKNVIGIALTIFCLFSTFSHAQTTFTHGVASGDATVLWFKPDANVTWVDIHFTIGNLQQNIRMERNSVNERFEQVILLNPGTEIVYSFTYSINGFVGFDTPTFTLVVADSPNSQSSVASNSSAFSDTSVSSASSSALNADSSHGILDNGSSVTIWLKPNALNVGWADIHYRVNGGIQQNVRQLINVSTLRFEHPFAAVDGAELSIDYFFTQGTLIGAMDTEMFNFTRDPNNVSSSSGSTSSESISSTSSSEIFSSSSSSSSSSNSSNSSSSSSSSSSSVTVLTDRSLIVHDMSTLLSTGITLRTALQQLVTQFNAINSLNPTSVEQLFARMWDTQNPAPGVIAGGEKCNGTLNGFTIECRPSEGFQAVNPEFFINNYILISLVNRLDLRDNVTMRDCGEYRAIFANTAINGGRNFIIFEAQVPNPKPGVNSGCLPIAQFWQSLSTEEDAAKRGDALRKFYFEGIATANVRPVIDIRNYAEGTGQVRTNMFMDSSWNLKEFKVGIDGEGISMIKPATVKSNPVAFLFDGNQTDSRAALFQENFIANIDSLLQDFNTFSLSINDGHNNGQSHASGQIEENLFGPAFFNTNTNSFQQAVAEKISTSNLTASQLMNRATAMTCGGCHEPGSFGLTFPDAIGPGQSWPNTLGFTHVSEFVDNGVFPLSPALNNVFLPVRLATFKSYLANPNLSGVKPGSPVKTPIGSTPVKPVAKKFNKRAG